MKDMDEKSAGAHKEHQEERKMIAERDDVS